ncbi:ATP-binding protein [Hydrogenophaga sp.]|uniref:ATP-binding protein n=1 Tax=Hydrogenophaga sp. TaxID=1904254 RepID=UPI0027194C87|nr:ATP-binding protein [Hydrogenophaga sp.]MDO9133624.1 ATP-binding protein [Hydrogenophaga sp.]
MSNSMQSTASESGLIAGAPVFKATLDNCDREPIHIPGLIQPSGALIAFEPAIGLILHSSVNLSRWLPVGNLPVKGRSLADLLGALAYERVANALTGRAGGPVRHEVVDLPARPDAGQPQALQAVVHSHRGICFVEIEPVASQHDAGDWLQSLSDTVDALRSACDLEDLYQRMAQRVKRLTGFDRAMVYRFDEDHHGHVVADVREPGMESFYDLHYPASDIPAQARELYVSNLVRYIPDVGYAPVPVLPWLDTTRLQPLDMSHAMLRSVSPMHIQYLQNMGVGSTLTLSLLVDGRLWGLIACHHRQPTALPMQLRRACYALSVTAGYMTGWFASQQRTAMSTTAAKAQAQIVETFNQVQVPLGDVIEHCATPLLQMVGASGGAFWRGDDIQPFGRWPDGRRGESVLSFVRQAFETSISQQIQTERADLQPPLEDFELREVCGVMAIKFDGFASSGLVWLRPEYRREVLWGGDPDKPVEVKLDAAGRPVLAPRSSFARWTTIVKGKSRAWTDLDLEAAGSLAVMQQILVVRDALDQISLSDRQFRSLVNLQADVYWQTDCLGRIVTMSKQLPFDHRMLEGRILADVFAEAGSCDGLTELRAVLTGERSFRALRVAVSMRVEETPFTCLFSGELLRDVHGQATGWHGTISDITRDAELEAEIQQKREIAEFANQAKSVFLANMSHEIRTPMNGVVGMVDVLMETELNLKQQRMLQTIQDSSLSLLRILDDILDYSKIEAEMLRLEPLPIRLRAVAESVVQLMYAASRAKNLSLSVFVSPELPSWIRTDPTRLRQILINLVGNAVKFTASRNSVQGMVDLTLEPCTLPDKANGLRMRVTDNGIGIAPDILSKLFQPFTQAEAGTARKFGGTGLGLNITKRLAELMGGRVSVESAEGVGSSFTVELPVQVCEPEEDATSLPTLTGVQVVALFQFDADFHVISSYCRAAGAEVVRVNDLAALREALRKLQHPSGRMVAMIGSDEQTSMADLDLPEGARLVSIDSRAGVPRGVGISVPDNPVLHDELILGVALAAGFVNDRGDAAPVEDGRPLARADALGSQTGSLASAHARRLILLAEDNVINREVIFEQLRILGYTAECAQDGEAALALWRSGRFDLLLTDCHMPNMDGYELSEAIRRAEPAASRMPIIAVTANVTRGVKEFCFARGMDDCIAKPLRMQVLADILLKWLPASPTTTPQRWLDWDPAVMPGLMGGSTAMHHRLWAKFLTSARDNLQQIAIAAAQADASVVASEAHKLCSSARTVGAMGLGDLCEALEAAGCAGDAAACSALAQELPLVFAAAAEAIEAHIA